MSVIESAFRLLAAIVVVIEVLSPIIAMFVLVAICNQRAKP